MWGNNGYGQLGDGTFEDKNIPTKIMDNISSVSLDFDISTAITADGILYIWGRDSSRLVSRPGTGMYIKVPTKKMDNVSSVSLVDDHIAAITTDGTLYMWGNNGYGQLGDGTNKNKSNPTKIMTNVFSVCLGDDYSGAVTTDGSIYMW